jgi:maleamate amidohydrolase
MQHLWEDLLSEQDKAVIRAAGYDKRGASAFDSRGTGENPAVLVIDMQRFIVGENVPILEAVKQEPIAMGEIAWQAMESIVPFVESCRENGLPIIYTRIIPHERSPDDVVLNIVDQLQPNEDDLIVDKNYPSPFYGTALKIHLTQKQIDTLILVGNSTSGCVRASAVDGRQLGFNVIVPYECVFDRIEASHKIGLLDMWMKYGTVLPTANVLQYVHSIKAKAP